MLTISGKLKVDKEKGKNGQPVHGSIVYYAEPFSGNATCDGISCGSAWVNDADVPYDEIRLEKAEFTYDRYGRVVGIRYAK